MSAIRACLFARRLRVLFPSSSTHSLSFHDSFACYEPLSSSFSSLSAPLSTNSAQKLRRHILVYGGNGALGSSIVQKFSEEGWNTVSVDLKENPLASTNFVINPEKKIDSSINTFLEQCPTLDVVVNAAGGWAGGFIHDTSVFDVSQKMWKMNTESAIAAAYIAAHKLDKKGLVVFVAAKPVVTTPVNTSFHIGYGMSKSAIVHLTKSLATSAAEEKKETTFVALAPATIDNPANRCAMPNADFNTWTRPGHISKVLFDWASGQKTAVNGSVYDFPSNDTIRVCA